MGANSSSPEGLANHLEKTRQKENTPFRLLTVRILRARNIQKADIFTESDCYVNVSLPTASSETVRTKTVPNCKNPVWNQAFCYRIDSRVKNILHLKICDEDRFTKDDHLYTVLFDVGKLQPGQTNRVNFKLNPEAHEELDVEFTLQYMTRTPPAAAASAAAATTAAVPRSSPGFFATSSRWIRPDRRENIATNGTLVARELFCLEVTIDMKKLKHQLKKESDSSLADGELTLTVKGSYEGTQNISVAASLGKTIVVWFHCIKDLQSNLEVTLPGEWAKLTSCKENQESKSSVILPLSDLPTEKKIKIGKGKSFYLYVEARDWPKDLDVRLAYDLCAEEKDFLIKRRKYVAPALKKVLQLQENLPDDEVPVVAVMTTGGGTRSFTAMYGSLLGLQKLNLLDCVTYITGLSGTTWTMGNTYEDANWSRKYMEETINEAQKQVTKCKINCFSPDKLKYYYNELKQKMEEEYSTSFIDLWGLVIESMLHDEKDNHKLSNQQAAVCEGQNPFPIYLAVNLKDNYSAQDFRDWLEFTPYEVGNFKYGAFIRSEDYGSEFFMGRLMKKYPEIRICYLQGMWSSIFSLDFMYVWNLAANSEDFWHMWTRDRVEEIEDSVPASRPYDVDTRLVTSENPLSYTLRDVLTGRPTLATYPNFMKGFHFHNEYLENKHFSIWKDTVLDNDPSKLMETTRQDLTLVDTGFFINTSYPPLLRPERKVDIILHINYSGGCQTLNLDEFSTYASGLGLPFPKVRLSEDDRKNLKECYVFDDTDDPAAPTILFFPLVNDTFRKYKEPGVERGPEDMEEGNMDVTSFLSPFTTREVCFSEKNFNRLVKLTEYNIMNNEDKIIEALRFAVERRKQQKL